MSNAQTQKNAHMSSTYFNVNVQQPNFQELLCYHSLSSHKVSIRINKCLIFEPNALAITLYTLRLLISYHMYLTGRHHGIVQGDEI